MRKTVVQESVMAMRVTPDENQPFATIEIPLEKPLPDYDLEELEQPTPRDVDSVLVSQGFRDLVDDSRGVLLDLIANFHRSGDSAGQPELDPSPLNLTPHPPTPLEIAQLTGAICPSDDEVYRPGLWIILRDTHAPPKQALSQHGMERIMAIAQEFARRMQLV